MEVIQELPDTSSVFDVAVNITLNNIKSLLEEIYPGWWDIQEDTEEQTYKIYIHFPKLVVKNYETGDSHTIYDMYVKIVLDNETYTINNRLEGCRATKTYKEYISGYNHSHKVSNAGRTDDKFTYFCLGESELSEKHIELREEFNLSKFEAYLYLLQSYLETESTEGGPYMYMSSIILENSIETPTSRHCRLFYEAVKRLKIPFNVNIDKINYKVNYNLILSDEFIHSLLPITLDSFKIKVSENGEEEPFLPNNIESTNSFIESYNLEKKAIESFNFKGLPVYRKIINDVDIVEETSNINYKVIPHPKLIDYLKVNLERDLYNISTNYHNNLLELDNISLDELPF